MTENLDIQHFLWPNQYMLTFIGLWPMDSGVSILYRFFDIIKNILASLALCLFIIPQLIMVLIYWNDMVVMYGEFLQINHNIE